MDLKIEITKNEKEVSVSYSEGADIHELVGLLATVMNNLSLQAQGIDLTKFVKQDLEELN